MTWIASTLNFMRTRPVWDNIFREATSNNLPHTVIVRTKDEAIDQAIVQFGNTAMYFGSGLLLNALVDRALKLRKTPLPKAVQPFFYLMKSFAIYSISAATVIASPQLRNYVTTLRTGTTNYSDMIGETDRHVLQGQARNDKANQYLDKFWKVIGAGLLLSKGFLVASAVGAKFLKKTPKALQWAQQHLGLKDGKYENFTPFLSAMFWTLPTYSGFFAAARDKYELKELMLRFGAFLFAFFILPKTVENTIDKFTANLKPSKILGPAKNIGYVGKLISSVIFCGSIPSIVNIFLTRQRVARDKQHALNPAIATDTARNSPIAQYSSNPGQFQAGLFQQFATAPG